MERKCYVCKVLKPLDTHFPSAGGGRKDYRCHECSRARNKEYRNSEAGKRKRRDTRYKRVYGISLEEYESMLESQGGVCAICERSPDCQDKEFAVDHCHKGGDVRAILCDKCNRVLGAADDDIDLMQKCIDFLAAT